MVPGDITKRPLIQRLLGRRREQEYPNIRAGFGGPQLYIEGLAPQPYDPEMAALDSGAHDISRERLQRGFGAPPIEPYAQIAMVDRIPIVRDMPVVKQLRRR